MTQQWVRRMIEDHPLQVDVEILEESSLAMAQSTIHNAMCKAKLTKADLARKMVRNRSFVTTMLSGDHNLTIKTMARALAACGCEIRFNAVPMEWNWQPIPQPRTQAVPVGAGTTMSV
jgi:hypothetical protein